MSQVRHEMFSAYTEICSDVTLFNTKGFFKNLVEELVSLAEEDNWTKTFENTEVGERVKAVMENKKIMGSLTEVLSRITPTFRAKDAKISSEKRLMAQAVFKEGKIDEALALASQAVIRAPMTDLDEFFEGGVTLALALWQRSEVLLSSGQAWAAVLDLKMAQKEHLPFKGRAQYYWRLGHCYKAAGEPARAKVSFELAYKLLGNDETSKTQVIKDIQSLDFRAHTILNPPCRKGAAVTGGAHENMPAFSKKIKIAEEVDKGRFAVADLHVNTGDVVVVEEPYAACLLPDYYGSHCLHCFTRLNKCKNEAPVWCPKCSGVAFCSARCKDTAIATYHSFECQFLDIFIGSGMSTLSHVALRMITQAGLNTSLSIYSKYLSNQVTKVDKTVVNDIETVSNKTKFVNGKEQQEGTKSLNEKELEDKVMYRNGSKESFEKRTSQIYSLCTHSNRRKAKDYFKRVVMAIFLTHCLKAAGFFESCTRENSEKAERSICEMIVHNLQLLQFNAHEIYETIRGDNQLRSSNIVNTALGIYPSAALFNHECSPAVARYFEGRKIVLRALRPLQPGEVVSENYGPHFQMRDLAARQRSLVCRYWFECKCVACVENWPTTKQSNGDTTTFMRCPKRTCTGKIRVDLKNLVGTCSKCCITLNENMTKIRLEIVSQCVTNYQHGVTLMENQRTLDAIEEICDSIDRYHEVGTLPHRDTHLAQDSLRVCFANFGNVYILRNGA